MPIYKTKNLQKKILFNLSIAKYFISDFLNKSKFNFNYEHYSP